MGRYQITIYRYVFGKPEYVDDDEVSCKNKWKAIRKAKNMVDYHKRRWGRMSIIDYDIKKIKL